MQIRYRVLDTNYIYWPFQRSRIAVYMYIAIKSARIPPAELSEYAICRTTVRLKIYAVLAAIGRSVASTCWRAEAQYLVPSGRLASIV